jgi:uncharacterized protein (UPF0248 family)
VAIINLIKAGYTGSLGQTTGAQVKGKNIVKAKIWSKRPANAAQTGALRSFESVNRLAGAIGRTCFDLTGLSAKGMLKHNAVARFLQPMLKNKIFEPANISVLVPLAPHCHLFVVANNPKSEIFQYRIYLGDRSQVAQDDKLIFMVFNDIGVVHFINVFAVKNQDISVPLHGISRANIQAFAFISSIKNKKRYLSHHV